MCADKVVELERASDNHSGVQGTFGFSIFGGFGTKFPACVCDVDPGGPADLSNLVHIGDRLLELNGDCVQELASKDLIQLIRTAPSPSIFTLSEDKELQLQVLQVLRKNERKAEGRARKDRLVSTGSDSSITSGPPPASRRRKSSPTMGGLGTGTATVVVGEDAKKKKLDKIIEVESSVNITNGQSSIVRVQHNKIVGRLEFVGESSSYGPSSSSQHSPSRGGAGIIDGSPRVSPQRDSPARYRKISCDERECSSSPYQRHKKFSAPDQDSFLHAGSTPNISLDSISLNSGNSYRDNILDHLPQHKWEAFVRKDIGLNGEFRMQSDSSGVNSLGGTPALGSVASLEEKYCKSEGSISIGEPPAVTVELDGDDESICLEEVKIVPFRTVEDEEDGQVDRDFDSGVALQIPSWDGHPLQSKMCQHSRTSLAEEILIGEIVSMKIVVPERKATEWKVTERKATERKETERKATERKETERKETERKETERKETDRKETDRKETEMEGSTKGEEASSVRERTQGVRAVRRNSSKKLLDDPYTNAVIMARRLFMLDGFKKSEVAVRLSDISEYGKSVAQEYLKFFDFQDQPLNESLRQFLTSFSLTGETQERERVIIHFSVRYHECNPVAFRSSDEVHGITIAMLLLNTDLHNQHGGKKMTPHQFAENLERINVKIPKSMARSLYEDIKKRPLQWAVDDPDRALSKSSRLSIGSGGSPSPTGSEEMERIYHVTIPGTFVEVEMSASAPLFKEGYILKKNIMEAPHKKVARGKRQWKPYYAYLKGFLLYLEPPRQGDLHLENTSSAISICHTLAMGAYDYHKKNSVLRVTTSDWQSFLLQANDTMDMQQWICAINKAAATYSSPPLAAPISSSSVFQRPTFPLAPTRNDVELQSECHESKVKSLRKDQEEHLANKSRAVKGKHNDLQNWFDKFEFQQFEIDRFQIYLASLSPSVVANFNRPLPSGLVPSPSISTLATSGMRDNDTSWKSITPPGSPLRRRSEHLSAVEKASKKVASPLLSTKNRRHS